MADPSGGYDEGAQVSMTLPPTKQYQGSPMMNLRSSTVIGLSALVREAFQDPVLRLFFTASGIGAEYFNEPSAPVSAPIAGTTEVSGAPEPAASGEQQKAEGAPHVGCEHGGKLAKKSGKRGDFLGCDAFPKCRFIAGDAK